MDLEVSVLPVVLGEGGRRKSKDPMVFASPFLVGTQWRLGFA